MKKKANVPTIFENAPKIKDEEKGSINLLGEGKPEMKNLNHERQPDEQEDYFINSLKATACKT